MRCYSSSGSSSSSSGGGHFQALFFFFAAFLREDVTKTELEAMLSALGDVTSVHAHKPPAAACIDSQALALLFSVLAALEPEKVNAQDCVALASSKYYAVEKEDALTALLRLGLGLCSEAVPEALLKTACDQGAFPYLLAIVSSPTFKVRILLCAACS